MRKGTYRCLGMSFLLGVATRGQKLYLLVPLTSRFISVLAQNVLDCSSLELECRSQLIVPSPLGAHLADILEWSSSFIGIGSR